MIIIHEKRPFPLLTKQSYYENTKSTMATTDPKLIKIIEVLKTEYNPIRLFLFGSRSNGTAHLDSDYDFVLVVKENNSSRHVSMAKARSLLHEKCQVSADVFLYSEKEFDEWKDERNSIPETAINTGREFELG